MMSINQRKSITVSLNVGDQLTTVSCGHIVSEVIKFLAYQRLQIPYTYQWLKQIVNMKKAPDDKQKGSLQSERHFRIASSALENLDFILKSLLVEISGPVMPEEVCVSLGATPVTCKEVYRLLLPTTCHKPQCQSTRIVKDHKLQSNVFRLLATSEELSQAFTNIIPPTNMHVFIRKKPSSSLDVLNDDNFVPASGSKIPKSCRVILIDFRTGNDNVSCCNEFQIFGDNINDKTDRNSIEYDSENGQFEIQTSESVKWFQSTYVMKGFKDCVVNGNSVTNSWIN